MKGILLIIGLILSIQLWTQEYQPAEYIGVEDGFSFGEVNSIIEDSEGFMWLCSAEGLICYDGVEWLLYQHIEGDSTSIPGNDVQWIIENEDENLIVSTIDIEKVNRFALYDKKEGKFRKVIFQKMNEQKEKTISLTCFKSTSGKIKAYGTVKGSKNQFFSFNYLGDGIFEKRQKLKVHHKSFDPSTPANLSEKYWIKGPNHYLIYDVDSLSLTRIEFSKFGAGHTYLPLDEKGRFWYPNYKPDASTLFDYFQYPAVPSGKKAGTFRIDNHWNIWIFEGNRHVLRFDRQSKQVSAKNEVELSIKPGHTIFQDKDGTTWMSNRFGLDKLRKKRKYFDNYFFSDYLQENNGAAGIYPIIELTDGKIHSISGTGFLNSLDPASPQKSTETKRISAYEGNKRLMLLASGVVAMQPHSNNQIWIRSINEVSLYDPLTDKFIVYPIPDSLKYFKRYGAGKYTSNLEMDETGNLWFNWNDRLFRFDTVSKTFHCDTQAIFIKGIIGIGEGSKWLCTGTSLSKLDKTNRVQKEYDIPFPIQPGREIDIFKVLSYRGKLWIGSKAGLLVFDPKTEKFNRYTTIDGLPHNMIYSILPYGNDLWMGTHYGLCRFNILTGDVKNYFAKDGLTHNEFNRGSACKGRDGTLYFGGLNGLNAFHPNVLDSLLRLEPSKLVWISFSKINGQQNAIQIYESNQLVESQPVEIFHGDKSFTFKFALLNFVHPADNTYTYYLEGLESDWIHAANLSTVNYPILQPGDYTFRVRAKDALGNPGMNELSIPVIVYGPWWESWWARGLFLFLAAAIIFGYNRWQTISLKKQKVVLEKTVQERTVELNAQKERAERSEKFKEQFLANMSHEIRTPMHAISGMTNILLRNRTFKHQQRFLKAIQQNAGNLLVILNDILDLSKIEAGKIEVEHIPVNPSLVIENVVEIMKLKAEEKGLTLQSSIDQKVPEYIYGDPTRLSQILLNLVGNAIKFTEKGAVNLSLQPVDDQLQFEVKDSGIGIPKDQLEHIFGKFNQVNESITRKYGGTGLGLNITRQLVELQNGKIWVESKENVGSCFFFELPLVPVEADKVQEKQITEEQLKEMGTALSRLKILLVEDNDFNVMVATDDLTHYIPKVNIGFAKNGNLAIQEFKNGNYDLILMDIQMPELSGYDATRAIRQLEVGDSHIPIIAMTASLLKSEIDLCYAAGMDSYIPKPYKIEELIGRVFEVVKNILPTQPL